MSTVSKSIKRLRTQNNMTQEQLAEKMHVTRQAVSNWETEKTQPDIDTLNALAETFDTDIYDLIYGNPKDAYRKYQKKYIITAAVCLVLLAIAYISIRLLERNYILIAGEIGKENWELYYHFYNLIYYFIPCLREAIVLFLMGLLTVSILSLWFNISIRNSKWTGKLALVLLFPVFITIWACSKQETNYPYILIAMTYWKRFLVIWCLSFISGVLLFLFFNKQQRKE